MVLAFVLGVAGALPFLVLAQVWAYVFVGVAGFAVASLVRDRRRGLIGLALGIAVPFTAYGAYAVAEQIQRCGSSACSGISSPNLTLVIAAALGLVGLTSGVAGYVVGRVARAIALRLEAR